MDEEQEKELKELFDKLEIRDITEEDRLMVKYSILLFLKLYIDNPPEVEKEDIARVSVLKGFLETIHHQAAFMSKAMSEDLAEKALRCSKIETITFGREFEEEDPKEIH
jgi:hypothetical protein